MKKPIAYFLTFGAANSAFAHDGIHLHPHGDDSLMAFALIVALAASFFSVFRRRIKK